jgi:chemotaxis protein MotB
VKGRDSESSYSDVGLAPEPTDENEGQEWLTTFADLCMLLLVFFILLYSMSTLDDEKFSETFSSVTRALSGQMEQIATSRITQEEAGVLLDQVLMQRQIIESQRKVFSEVKALQTEKGIEGVVSATFENGVITLRAPGDVFFKPGQVRLSPLGEKIMLAMKDFFVQHPDQVINIRGYTDDTQPTGRVYQDNWEVSALRAVNVLRFLLEQGIEANRLTATGLASLNPIVPNTSAENRAKNRRVEFILEKRVTGP